MVHAKENTGKHESGEGDGRVQSETMTSQCRPEGGEGGGCGEKVLQVEGPEAEAQEGVGGDQVASVSVQGRGRRAEREAGGRRLCGARKELLMTLVGLGLSQDRAGVAPSDWHFTRVALTAVWKGTGKDRSSEDRLQSSKGEKMWLQPGREQWRRDVVVSWVSFQCGDNGIC